ncbi:MAG: FAD:protein FMN transferase [Bacteroidota bacterium]
MNRNFLYIISSLLFFISCSEKKEQSPVYKKVSGITMGVVTYNVTYSDLPGESLYPKIDSLLSALNNSLSTYVPDSEISDLNTHNTLTFRTGFFLPMLRYSKEVYQITSGAFDPTVGPLVNLWGFGPGKETNIPDSALIVEKIAIIGFDKVKFDEQSASIDEGVYLDFSAIAKGYAVDLVAEFLEAEDIKNYYVEIGGEVSCKGVNNRGETWKTGIFDPRINEDPSRKIAAIVSLDNMALATSGNYRNFYIKNGKKYAHTISPFTGYPVEHSLLSASVFSDNCTIADAYATAFMVMGVEKAIPLIEANPALEAHLIYSDDNGALKSYTSEGIKNNMILE